VHSYLCILQRTVHLKLSANVSLWSETYEEHQTCQAEFRRKSLMRSRPVVSGLFHYNTPYAALLVLPVRLSARQSVLYDLLTKQDLSKPRLATPLHACVLVTYLLIYLGTYLFTRLLTRYVLQPLLYKLSKIVLI